MESVLKKEKLIEVVRLFPCIWQVNTKSYKDAVAKANENSHVAGVGQNSLFQELPLPHPPLVPSKQSKKKKCFLVFFTAGAIHLLLHLLNFLLTTHVPLV